MPQDFHEKILHSTTNTLRSGKSSKAQECLLPYTNRYILPKNSIHISKLTCSTENFLKKIESQESVYDQLFKGIECNQIQKKSVRKLVERIKSHDEIIKKITEKNLKFIEHSQHLKTNQAFVVLNQRQQELLSFLDQKLFINTFEREMCQLMDEQIDIMYEQMPMNAIIVMLPGNAQTTEISRFKNLNRIYTAVNNFSKEYIYEKTTSDKKDFYRKKYIFTCPHKINLSNEKNAFVFFNNKHFNEKMIMCHPFSETPVCVFFYDKIAVRNEFLFGCYEFYIDFNVNKKSIELESNAQNIKCLEREFRNNVILEEFMNLENRISYILSLLGRKRSIDQTNCLKDPLTLKKQKKSSIEDLNKEINTILVDMDLEEEYCNFSDQEIEIDVLDSILNSDISNEELQRTIQKDMNEDLDQDKIDLEYLQQICEINKSIDIQNPQTQELKLQIGNQYTSQNLTNTKILDHNIKIINERFQQEQETGAYNVERILNSKGFNASTFSSDISLKLEQDIIRSVANIINDLDIDKDKNLLKIHSTVIALAPIEYCIHPSDYEFKKHIKESKLKNSKVDRYHFVISRRTKRTPNNIGKNHKIVVGLTTSINLEEKDNTVFLFLKKGFDRNHKPLFDPNKFSIVPYFYNRVIDHSKDAGYPLYEFQINNQCNICQLKDVSKYFAENHIPNIKNCTIEEYIKKSYDFFNLRAIISIKNLQDRLSMIE